MAFRDSVVTTLVWLRRLALLAVLSYFSYSMLLMGYILVGTSCQPYGRENFHFYRYGGVLLLAGGLTVLFFTLRWLTRLLRRREQGTGTPG